MKPIKKHLIAAAIIGTAALTSIASADQLKVYSTLFASTANIVVWDDHQPVSGGSVAVKDDLDRVVAESSLNSQGRAYIYLPSVNAGQEYTVFAESKNLTGSGELLMHDSPSSRGEVAARAD